MVPDKLRLCTPVVGPLTSEPAAVTLRRFNCNYHFSILQITGSLSLSWLSERWSWRGAAFLDGELAFDSALHEKLMLLEAAAMCTDKCTLQMQPSARPVHPRDRKQRTQTASHACCAWPSKSAGCARKIRTF